MKLSLINISILTAMLVAISHQAPIGNGVCRHLPYDFYHIPGTRDFFFLRYEYSDFTNARAFCVSIGMDLPSIVNKEQNDLIHSFIIHSKYPRYHTIGISPLNNINNNFWLNGDNFTFKNFRQNMSTNVLDMHIHISAATGLWELHSCDVPAGTVCHVRC